MAVTISQVSFEHHRIALGIGETSPRISWRYEGNVSSWSQSGYSVEVARQGENQDDPLQVDLFHANSSNSLLVPWPTVSLTSAESATIRVRAYGEDDQPDTPWSDPVSVETGLLTEDAWSGALMISADKETEKDLPHQPLLFRKEFSVAGGIEKARLYITAYGLYQASINGETVGTGVLAPGWQSYNHRLVYDTYDVTNLLLAGENAFGIHVGEGWYAGRLGYGAGNRNLWGDTPGTMALLVVTLTDGTQVVVRTDQTWQASTGAIITSELYNGEVYDSRLEQTGWSSTYDQLAAPDGPPIRRIEEVKLQQVLTSPTGKTILDFGQNLVGWLRLRIAGPEGSTIKLVHAEVLENGEIATRPHGFRYVTVDGWPTTDCPQRDERLGWTGDSHAFSPTANFLYDTSGFWRGWLKDFQSEQVEGAPPLVIPSVPAAGPVAPTAIWGDAIVVNPWNTYRSSADLEALRAQYTGAKAWLDSGIPRSTVGLWNQSTFQLGDWLDPLAPPDDAGRATTSSSYVADAYLVYVTGLVAQMASELGLEEDKSRYEESAADLKVAFREAWMSSDGIVANETQTGLALPLYFDLFEDDEQATAAASRLQKIVVANDYLVGTGFAGTHLLGLALTKHNMTDTFYRMLLQTTVPSWLYQVKMGATTTWERWDSLLPDGSLNPGEMTSFNHYAVGSVANWIYQVVGGLAPVDPGWKTVRVNVIPGGNITWAKASYLSPYGKISTQWEVDETGFHLLLDVPPNVYADVTLPGGGQSQRVGSGTHEFSDAEFRLGID